MPKLVQFDFPFPGPFGAELAEAMKDLADSIAREPGLIWKIWLENPQTGEAGGVYLFKDAKSADAYLAMHTARLAKLGVTQIRAKVFDVNTALSNFTRGPVG